MRILSNGVVRWIPMIPLMAALCLASCGNPARRDGDTSAAGPAADLPTVAGRERFSLLLVTLDTTRADHLGSYGYQRRTTPNLDQLARGGVRFEHVTAPVPLTLPSHASLFTGQYPFTHAVRDNVNYRLGSEVQTLAEVLGAAGYSTGGFIGAYVLNQATGIGQGFDAYTEFDGPATRAPSQGHLIERPGGEVVDETLAWIGAEQRRNFFAWAHLFDPHLPYDPPSPYRERHPDRPYDGEIAYVDALVGTLVAGLEELGLSDSTLVVVTADHGEGLGEHGETRHGALVYEATVRVPLLMWAPRVLPRGIVVRTPASLVDVMPTVLGILNVEDPDAAQRDGIDARAAMVGADVDLGTPYSESLYPLLEFGFPAQRALRRGNYKLVIADDTELYDLAADPAETDDIASEHPALTAELEDRLRQRIGSDDPTRGFAATGGAAATHLGRLRGLGYIGGGGASPAAARRSVDPESMVTITEAFEDAVSEVVGLLDEERWNEADAVLDTLEELVPDGRVARYYRGHMALLRGDTETAVRHLRAAIDLDPAYTLPYLDLASAYWQANERDQAFAFLAECIETFPETVTFRILLATYLHEDGQFDRALRTYRDARLLAPREPVLLSNLALLHLTRNEKALAAELARQLTEVAPRDPSSWARLGMLLIDIGDLPGAAQALRRSLELDAEQPEVRYNLGLVLVLEAAESLDGSHLADPAALYARQVLAELIRSGALQIR